MIIGITGTNGAGKGTVVEYLMQKKGFKHYSAREFILKEVYRRGLEPTRENITPTANDLRAQYGATYVVDQLLKEARLEGGDSILESIRVVAEAELIKKEGALLIAVDADRKVRYERTLGRGSSTDNVSFEEFCALEDMELSNMDPTKQNLLAVRELADYTIINNGTLEELHEQIESLPIFN